MSESRKAIIHVGLHKTGSTAIQLTCSHNSGLLAEHGYYYPRFGADCWANHSVPLSLMFMVDPYNKSHTVRNIFKTPQVAYSREKEIRKAFEMEIQSTRCQNILISGEDISVFSKSELHDLISFLSRHDYKEIEVVLYVRHPVRFALSNAQELVRAGVVPIGRAIGFGDLQQVREKIKKIISVVGESAVHVMSFEQAVSEVDDILIHFFNYLGIPKDMDGFVSVRSNESMPIEKILAISALCHMDGALARLASGMIQNSGSRIVPNRLLEEFVLNEAAGDVEYLSEYFEINYLVCVDHVEQKFDRSIFLMNLHDVRKIANEQAGMSIDWASLFGYICEDTAKYFRDIYYLVLVMAYNCTRELSFKSSIDEGLRSGDLRGKYINGLFQVEGDQIDPDNFDEKSYLLKNPDLQRVRDHLFEHYYAFGRFAGREV